MTTPQFGRHTHRAREAMHAWARTMPPDIWTRLDQVRREWLAHDPHIYLPFAATQRALPARSDPIAWSADLALASGWGAWRMTQGIYRYDPAVYAAVIDTPITGDLPVSVLDHMPEWAVYIETPGWQPALTHARPVDGVLVWRNRIMGDEMDVLQCVLLAGQDGDGTDYDREVLTLPLSGTLDASVDRLVAEARKATTILGMPSVDIDQAEAMRQTLPPILSLLLYLCSASPDLTRRGQPAMPANPEPVRTRRTGWRLFPADGPREWDVGVRIGAALRAAYAREETGGEAAASGRHVRPHVRRAHWHTILSGARKRDDGTVIPASEQRRDLRWMPPIPVAITDLDALPAVVHRVRP